MKSAPTVIPLPNSNQDLKQNFLNFFLFSKIKKGLESNFFFLCSFRDKKPQHLLNFFPFSISLGIFCCTLCLLFQNVCTSVCQISCPALTRTRSDDDARIKQHSRPGRGRLLCPHHTAMQQVSQLSVQTTGSHPHTAVLTYQTDPTDSG